MTHDETLAAFTAQIDSQLLGLGRFADAAHPEVALLAKQVQATIRAVALTIVMGPEALTPPAADEVEPPGQGASDGLGTDPAGDAEVPPAPPVDVPPTESPPAP